MTRQRTTSELANDFALQAHNDLIAKFQAGQAEHGGSIERKATHKHIYEEALDLLVYTINHLDHIEQIREHLTDVIYDLNHFGGLEENLYLSSALESATIALNVLTIGNEEGILEEEL